MASSNDDVAVVEAPDDEPEVERIISTTAASASFEFWINSRYTEFGVAYRARILSINAR
jgi:hypothetical protein